MKKYILSLFVLLCVVGFVNFNTNKPIVNNEKVKINKIDLSEKFKITGCVNVITITKNTMSYGVTNKNHRENNFYMNANYFTINNTPVGEVRVNGKTIKSKNKNGGYFTSNGKSPHFYYNKRPSNVLYSSQTHTPIIINNIPNSKIFNKKWAKYKLPRLVIGENKKGDIIVIHTVDNTRCSVFDFYQISKSLGLVNCLMFDGGASIEVGVFYKDIKYEYQIVSDLERKFLKIPTPSVFIVGNFKNN